MLFQTCMSFFFFFLNTKDDIGKVLVSKQLTVAIDLYCIFPFRILSTLLDTVPFMKQNIVCDAEGLSTFIWRTCIAFMDYYLA